MICVTVGWCKGIRYSYSVSSWQEWREWRNSGGAAPCTAYEGFVRA